MPVLPKLIALDLDGTLLTSAKTITPRARAIIGRLERRGVRTILCTGRPPRTARTFARELKLTNLAIVYNGGAVVDFDKDEALRRFDMPAEVALAALEEIQRAYPDIMCGIETHHGWYVDEAHAAVRGLTTEPTGVGNVRGFVQDAVTKLLFRHPEESAEDLSRSLHNHPVHCTWSLPGLLEVTAKGVTKRRALEWVARDMGIDASQVAAFGDEHNDKEMLAWAGRSVAMANASDETKACAGQVTLSNDEDGVAEVLEAWEQQVNA